MDEQMMLRPRATVGTDIASSRVAVFTPPKNGVNESSEVTGIDAAMSAPEAGITVSTDRDAKMSRIPM